MSIALKKKFGGLVNRLLRFVQVAFVAGCEIFRVSAEFRGFFRIFGHP